MIYKNSGNAKRFSDRISSKAESKISVKVNGIGICTSDEHPWNAYGLILVTEVVLIFFETIPLISRLN